MKTFFCLLFLTISCLCYSQNNKLTKDTLTWTDGTTYAGTIIKEDKHTGLVQFMTEDSQIHKVSSSSIAHLKRANEQIADDKLPPVDKKSTTTTQQKSDNQSDAPINWSDPNIPHKALIKHRTGIGLTVTGTTLFVGGIVMIGVGASNNGQTTTTTNGYSTQTNVNIGPEGIIGVLSVIVGLPMMISGILKLTKSKKMARMSMIHLH